MGIPKRENGERKQGRAAGIVKRESFKMNLTSKINTSCWSFAYLGGQEKRAETGF